MHSLRRWQTWGYSFIGWTIYAILDTAGSWVLLVRWGEKPVLHNVIIWNFAEAYVWVLFTPLIYAIAVRYGLNHQSWKKALAVQLPLSLLVTASAAWLLVHMAALLGWADTSRPFFTRLIGIALQDLPRYYVTLGVAYCVRLGERETESSRLEARLAQAQLEILRSQMEPHFLFNALNSIAALTRIDPAAAERMTLKLAAFLRVSLDCAGSQEISLKQELDFLQNYLDIQLIRFRDRLTVHLDVDCNLLSAPVPSLILQPLVENAIRHGIAKSAAPGHVNITAARHNGSIKIEIADNGAGVADDTAQEYEGFGLRNTRARLRQLYGDHQNLHLENAPGGGCRVSLTIPLPHPAAVA